MKHPLLVLSLVLLPVALSGQKNAPKPPNPCTFDTAAHTDTLTLEFTVTAFRDNSTVADTFLSRGFGEMIRAHFIAPRTISQLLYPNTYDAKRVFVATAGTLQFNLRRDGTLADRQWFAASIDRPTDLAIEQAVDATVAAGELRDLAVLLGTNKQQFIRLRFRITKQAGASEPLLRLRAPMVRVDTTPTVIPDRTPFLVPGGPQINPNLTVEFSINELGSAEKNSVQVVTVDQMEPGSVFLANILSQQWIPALVAGCPVKFRTAYVAMVRRR